MKRRLNPEYIAKIPKKTLSIVGEDLPPEDLQKYCELVVESLEQGAEGSSDSKCSEIEVELKVPATTLLKMTPITWRANLWVDFHEELSEGELAKERKARLLRMSIRDRFEKIERVAKDPILFTSLSFKRTEDIIKLAQLILEELHELDEIKGLEPMSSLPSNGVYLAREINRPII